MLSEIPPPNSNRIPDGTSHPTKPAHNTAQWGHARTPSVRAAGVGQRRLAQPRPSHTKCLPVALCLAERGPRKKKPLGPSGPRVEGKDQGYVLVDACGGEGHWWGFSRTFTNSFPVYRLPDISLALGAFGCSSIICPSRRSARHHAIGTARLLSLHLRRLFQAGLTPAARSRPSLVTQVGEVQS
jgi:hypothetical protein